MSVVVRYAVLPAARIFNLTSPRWLPEISLPWRGRRPWHDAHYAPVRDLMEQLYVAGFNRASGHYERLEASVLADGFRNPVVLSAGGLRCRRVSEIPPERRTSELVVSEYLGGSRIWVAQRHDLDVPAIVNDHAGVLSEAEALPSLRAVLDRFRDKPRTARYGPEGVYLNDMPFAHLPPESRYTLAEQSRIRAGIIARIRTAVADWLAAHD